MAVRKEEVRVTADVSNFVTKMAAAGSAASGFAARLDEADGRMSNLVQTGLALAPALVPLGAAAVPAIAGLANELGIAAAAAGVAVLAFQGIGDAVKALDAYKLDPTAANFAKLQQAMEKLGPASQEFALYIGQLEPKLRSIQKVAAQGLLPGVQESIGALLPLLPQVKNIVFSLSSTLGDLVQQGANALTDDSWQSFFSFIEADAAVTLRGLGTIVGNLATGFRDLWMAFDPLSQGFTSGLADMSGAFADWANGLAQTQGFQDFLAYISKSGPEALHALGAIADALLQIVEAAAPVGLVALPAITAVAKGISALADSSVGPAIIATAAAVGLLGRSLALLKTVGLRGSENGFIEKSYVTPFKAIPGAMAGARKATLEFAAAEREAGLAHARYIGSLRASSTQLELLGKPGKGAKSAADELVAANKRAAESSGRLAEAEKTKASAIRNGAASFGKGAAAAAGLAIATSGIADGMGLSNTASLALMGTIAGPWGAAIGGGIGLAKDLAAANNDVEDAMRNVSQIASSGSANFSAFSAGLTGLRTAADGYAQSIGVNQKKISLGWSGMSVQLKSPAQAFALLSDTFTHSSEESVAAVHKQTAAYMTMRENAAEVYASLNDGNMSLLHASDQVADQFVNHITPALSQAGIGVKDFLNSANGSGLRTEGLKAIQTYFASFDSAAGKSKAVGEALAALGGQMDTNASQANALKAAMDSLFGTQLNQSAATDAWTQGLRDLGSQIEKTKGQIQGQSKAALNNRAAIRSSVTDLQAKVAADAAAGVSGGKLVDTLLHGRDAIIKQATAAGASRGAVAAYLHTLGLTPKNLVTIIKADGALSATQKVQALAKVYKLTPRQLRTLITEAGSKPTEAKVRALAKQYNLTPKQVHTLLSATDAASRKAMIARSNALKFRQLYLAALDAKDGASAKSKAARQRAIDFAKRYLATLDANDPARGVILSAIQALNSFNGRHATATITTIHRTVFTKSTAPGTPANPTLSANGSMWSGRTRTFADGGFSDSGQYVPRVSQMRTGGGNILWSEPETGWEAYISGKPGMKARNLEIWRQAGEKLGAQFVEYANGGLRMQYGVKPTAPQVVTQMVAAPSGGAASGLAINYNGPVYAHDPNELARKQARRDQVALAAMVRG